MLDQGFLKTVFTFKPDTDMRDPVEVTFDNKAETQPQTQSANLVEDRQYSVTLRFQKDPNYTSISFFCSPKIVQINSKTKSVKFTIQKNVPGKDACKLAVVE